MRVPRRVVVVVGAVVLAGGVPGAALADAGGNSSAAQTCQQGGYANVVGIAGPFKNAGDCVSYAAQGGSFYPAHPTLNAQSSHSQGPCINEQPVYQTESQPYTYYVQVWQSNWVWVSDGWFGGSWVDEGNYVYEPTTGYHDVQVQVGWQCLQYEILARIGYSGSEWVPGSAESATVTVTGYTSRTSSATADGAGAFTDTFAGTFTTGHSFTATVTNGLGQSATATGTT